MFRPVLAHAQQADQGFTPAQQGVDASGEFFDPNWKPLFFAPEQNLTMVALCAVMIPATETQGAKEALVNRYVDLILSAESPEIQRDYVASLKYIDDESAKFYRKPFRDLTPDQQADLLIPMAYPLKPPWTGAAESQTGFEHFVRVKGLIVEGYYSSEIGDKELGWDGAYAHGRFAGCPAEEKK